MNRILSSIFLAIAIGSDRGLSISDPGPEMKRSSNTCGDPTDALPFYRIYNPTETNYLYTIGTGVVGTVGTTFQGVAALVFATQEESTVPFYHLTNAPIRDNFYTISTTERDTSESERLDYIANHAFTDIEIAGYVLPLASQCS
ncbi:hypothetical protein B0H13DRAFT_2375673 [Mycena leptocephala]|nr:hypothetical protein B0H13DRAFT_2375673 [Mycena leptocephala]